MMIDAAQFAELPVEEKLKLVTSLWDQIALHGKTSLPDSLLDDAEDRIAEMTADPNATISEDEMWRQADDLR